MNRDGQQSRRVTAPGLLLRLVAGGVGGQRRDEGLLRNFHPPNGLHPLLAFLLLLEKLALAGDVTAVALAKHVLADGPDVLARNDSRTDRGLDRHLELLARDELLELGGHLVAVRGG